LSLSLSLLVHASLAGLPQERRQPEADSGGNLEVSGTSFGGRKMQINRSVKFPGKTIFNFLSFPPKLVRKNQLINTKGERTVFEVCGQILKI